MPEGGRVCNRCREYKTSENFTPFKLGCNGLYPICKTCRVQDSKVAWINTPLQLKILNRAKSRASKTGKKFNLELTDIQIPEICPVFKVPMKGKYAPSIDRIDSSKGYVKGNIHIISWRANSLKSDATPEELKQLSDYFGAISD